MARQTFESWIPEEYGGPVLTKVQQTSAVEALGRGIPMATDTRHVPRSGGMSFAGAIAKGAAYPEDANTNDEVLLTAIKFGTVLRVADEDLRDTTQVANIIQTKQLDWARGYAIGFDNACLGVTAAANGGTIPFTSVYKALTTTNAAVSYTANANRVQTAGTGANVTYAQISSLFAKLETSAFWSDADNIVIAHPTFKAQFRALLDSTGRPIFSEYGSLGQEGTSSLFGVPIRWSLGAKTHATATDAPTGNPLVILANRQFLFRGDRAGMEYNLAGADSGPAFLTDEALLKVRIRRGFVVANENAVAVLELLP